MTVAGAVTDVVHIGPPRLTAGLDRFARLGFNEHVAMHGGLQPLALGELIDLAERIGLRGRGGAGFPFARKVRAVAESIQRGGSEPCVVVNATEGEPASWKDKMLLSRAPHLVLDGAAIAALALRAGSITLGLADHGIGTSSVLAAVAERRMPAPTTLVNMPHRFISGESGALVNGINGEVPIPPGRKVLASRSGVGGRPTLLSNAETYAQLAIATRLGPHAYATLGTPTEPGTVLLTVGGTARYPAVVEAPTGIPLKHVLERCAANVGAGVLTGGFHGTWINAHAADHALVSREGLAAVGGTLGAGIILPLGDDTCPLGEATRVVNYLAGQSAGQCGPCRLGLPDVGRAMAAIADGSGRSDAVNAIRAAAGKVRGRGACSHPDGTARFALSAIETFTDDLARHLTRAGCHRPVRGTLPVPASETLAAERLAINWKRCDGHGLCAHLLPELIRLDPNGYPVFTDAVVPDSLEPAARKAVAACPALALRLVQTDAQATRP